MTIHEMREQQRNLRAELDRVLSAGVALAQNPGAELTAMQNNLNEADRLRAQIQALENGIQAAQSAQTPAQIPAAAREERTLHDMLSSREYTRAFRAALRGGWTCDMPVSNDQQRLLMDALTIGGGTPAGADGGFLVPEDVDTTIREVVRQQSQLRSLFSVETVGTNSGRRVMATDPTKGMTALDGELPAGGIPKDDQPTFAQVNYALTTYGLIVPMSRELAQDENANLEAYLGRWFGKKQAITENLLLKARLDELETQTLAPTDEVNAVNALRSILIKLLDPAISMNAKILVNQSSYEYLDSLNDEMGRPLINIDPMTGESMIFKNRQIVLMSDAQLPNNGGKYPLYVGDFTQYATLFERGGMEMTATDIGGGAFESNGLSVRGIKRMGTAVFDKQAAVRREIQPAT